MATHPTTAAEQPLDAGRWTLTDFSPELMMPMDAATRERINRNMPSPTAAFMDEAAGQQADWKGWVPVDMRRAPKIWLPDGTPYRMEKRDVPEGWYTDTAGNSPDGSRQGDSGVSRMSDAQGAGNRQGDNTQHDVSTTANASGSHGDGGMSRMSDTQGASSGSGMDEGRTQSQAAPLKRMLSSHTYEELVGAGGPHTANNREECDDSHHNDGDADDMSDLSASRTEEPQPVWSAKAREMANGTLTHCTLVKDAQMSDDDSPGGTFGPIPSVKPYRPGTTSMSDDELIVLAHSGDQEQQEGAKTELDRRVRIRNS